MAELLSDSSDLPGRTPALLFDREHWGILDGIQFGFVWKSAIHRSGAGFSPRSALAEPPEARPQA
jgi:hypothetical protein